MPKCLVPRTVFVLVGVSLLAAATEAKPTLLDLAKQQFDSLTAAEKLMFQKVEAGEWAICGGDRPSDDAAEWTDEQRIRAECLHWLLTDGEGRKHITHRGVRIQGAGVHGKLDLEGAEVPHQLWFERCVFDEDVVLSFAQLKGLLLQGCRIQGMLAGGAKIDGPLFLGNGFQAKGEVRLLGAKIGGDLTCIDGKFDNPDGDALSADRVEVNGDVFLGKGFEAQGEVRLLGAKIGGNLTCTGGMFHNPDGDALSADGVEVNGSVFLRNGFEAKGRVSFVEAQVRSSFQWRGVSEPQHAKLDLRSAEVGTFWDDQQSWPEAGKLWLHGFGYDQLHDGALAIDIAQRIRWLRLQYGPGEDQHQFRSQPYEQLAEVLRASGHVDDAKKVLIAKEKDRLRYGKLRWHEHIWRRLLGLTIGFGYRPWRAAWISLGIIILGTLLFHYGRQRIKPTSTSAFVTDEATGIDSLDPNYPSFNAFVYALDEFVPLVNLHQAQFWTVASGRWLRMYLWVHILSGWTLSTLLAVGLSGLITR